MNSPPQSNKCEEKDEKGPLRNQIFDETKIGQIKAGTAGARLSAMDAKRKTHERMNGEAQW